tara:strand:+ start:345 stop:1034 length:690 start_codon:yes stop_codon:yes gene_type:complete
MKKDSPSIIILCGGKGLRLRPITNDIPKPLVMINDKPILQYILNQYSKYKFNKFYIATGYKTNLITEFMSENFHSLDYKIIDSGDTDILSRIRDCLKKCDGDFILSYGDTISDINLDKLVNYHKKDPQSVTVTSFPIKIPFGVMEIDERNFVKSFIEKPTLSSVMNIGYFYFSKKHHDLFYQYDSFVDILLSLSKNNKLKSFMHSGIHITVNTIAELEYANKNIKKIFN